MEKLEPSHIAGMEVEWCSHFEKPLTGSPVKHNYYTIQQFHSEEDLEMNTCVHHNLYTALLLHMWEMF